MSNSLTSQAFLRSSRLPFLLLPPVCVLLGLGTAMTSGGEMRLLLLLLVSICAVVSHMSVNLLNEYFDFRSGVDFHTIRTPFSGGSGFLPETPQAASHVLWLGLATLLLVSVLGCYLAWQAGWFLLPLGVLGVLLVLTYTSVLNRHPWLCWLAPGLGFGLVIVVGTHYVLASSINASSLMAAIVVFLLANNLLLLNQFPDISADRKAGRNHLLIAYGTKAGALVYGVGTLLIAAVILLAVITGIWPVAALLALLAWLPSLWAWHAASFCGASLGQHHGAMAANVVTCLLVPAVLGAVLLLAG